MEMSFGKKRVRQLELCIKLDNFVGKLNGRDQLVFNIMLKTSINETTHAMPSQSINILHCVESTKASYNSSINS